MCDARRLLRIPCPSAWLWGCSSGRLVQRGVHDPSGVALAYLLSRGGSCSHLIGALWDVTDRDIDNLSLCFMKSVISLDEPVTNTIKETSSALVDAREVCKMKFAVGCAVIHYGLPSFVSQGLSN